LSSTFRTVSSEQLKNATTHVKKEINQVNTALQTTATKSQKTISFLDLLHLLLYAISILFLFIKYVTKDVLK